MEGIRLAWKGKGFGNKLIMAHLVKICNDNGIPTVLQNRSKINGLVDVPMYEYEKHEVYKLLRPVVTNTYENKNCNASVINMYLHDIEQSLGKRLEIDPDRHDHVPVTFSDIPEVPEVDVALCTATGPWAPYRDWPYFAELKTLFGNAGITYIDMNKEGIYSLLCLNYVKKAKLYLGLETGMSHYVSKLANGKALILQSGFTNFDFWAYPYKYDCLKVFVPCSPCFINIQDIANKRIECPIDHRCMKSLTAERVFTEVLKRL